MAKKAARSWPAWLYGPGGESRIFQESDVIPEGWVDGPAKVGKSAKVKQLGVDTNLNGSETIEEIVAAFASGTVTLDEIESAEATRSRPRAGITDFVQTERARLSARAEGFAVLEEAGVELSEDASDEELSEALDALEE